MGSLSLMSWITKRRIKESYGLLVAAASGVLLAVTMIAATLIHSNTMATAGLNYSLERNTSQAALNFHIVVPDRPLGPADYAHLDSRVTQALDEHIGWLIDTHHRAGQSPLFPSAPDVDSSDPSLPGADSYVFFREGFLDHARLTAGNAPSETVTEDADGNLHVQAIVGLEVASSSLNLIPGKEIYLAPMGLNNPSKIAVEIVGVAEPRDPESSYWFGDLSKFKLGSEGTRLVVPLYIPRQALIDGIGKKYPMLLGYYQWFATLDLEDLEPRNLSDIERASQALESDLNQAFPRSLALSALENAISDYKRNLNLANVPLYLFTSLVTGVTIYFLVIVTRSLARSREREIGLLRSRGASRNQIATLLGLGEGLLVSIPAATLGPLAGWGLSGFLPVGGGPSETTTIPLTFTPFIVGGISSLICIGMFIASSFALTGRSTVTLARTRDLTHQPAGRLRPALEFLVFCAVVLVWWQIQGRGGFLTQELLGDGLDVDLSLLLGPGLALLASGLLVSRILPILMRTIGRLLTLLKWSWIGHGLTRLSRTSPSWEGLTVLIMVSTALAVFGSTLYSSMSMSEADQTRYEIGGEVVVADWRSLGLPLSTVDQKKLLNAIPEVATVTPVLRGSLGVEGESGAFDVSLVALDPSSAQDSLWFRSDFSDTKLATLFSHLQTPVRPREPMMLPERANLLGLWVNPEEGIPFHNLWVAIRDTNGLMENIRLGEVHAAGWTYFEGEIPVRPYLNPPYSIQAIYISGPQFTSNAFKEGTIAIDDISVGVGEAKFLLEGFEAPKGWEALPKVGAQNDIVSLDPSAAHSGDIGIRFSWSESISGELRGIFIAPAPLPLPAVGGSAFNEGELMVGKIGGSPTPIAIRSIFNQFPTLYPDSGPVAIVNLEHFNSYRESLPSANTIKPDEFWLGLKSDADIPSAKLALEELTGGLASIRFREDEVRIAREDPLSGGALAGISWLALGTLMGIAFLGLIVYAWIGIKESRSEFGLLLALGLSKMQLRILVMIEHVLLAGMGLFLGSLLGSVLSNWVLQYLDVSSGGRSVMPPMEIVTNPTLATLAYGAVVGATVVITLVTFVYLTTIRVHESLRFEE